MKITDYPQLSRLTTLKLGGRARALIQVENREELDILGQILAKYDEPPYWLGKGSNILAKDGELPLVLVMLKTRGKPEITNKRDGKVEVSVDAGYALSGLLGFCVANGLSGLEGLIGIPGSVGGCVKMNAGSFGAETGKSVREVVAWVDGEIKTYKFNELKFSYRNLSFPDAKKKVFIINVKFALTQAKKNDILKEMNHDFFQKKSRQPLKAFSAGCVFRNPPAAPSAGILLDNAGLRGKKIGGMQFSPKHANFLVNTGNGRAHEALELIELGKSLVKRDFGVELETEVKIIPWD